MKININMSLPIEVCPYCYGQGKLKAMQSAVNYKGVSIRSRDTLISCKHCNGTGILKGK